MNIAVYLWGLLCQLLDEFAAVEAAVEVSPLVTGGGSMQLHCILNASCYREACCSQEIASM